MKTIFTIPPIDILTRATRVTKATRNKIASPGALAMTEGVQLAGKFCGYNEIDERVHANSE